MTVSFIGASGFVRGAGRYVRVPALEVNGAVGDAEAGRFHEIGRDHGGDVGDRKAVTRQIGRDAQPFVENPTISATRGLFASPQAGTCGVSSSAIAGCVCLK